MQINETCRRWQLHYALDDAKPKNEGEERFIRAVLHTAGDIVEIADTLPDDPELKEKALQALLFILGEAQAGIEACIESAIVTNALHTPLQKGFTYQEIFGRDLDASLKDLATNEKEENIISDYLIPEELDDGENED